MVGLIVLGITFVVFCQVMLDEARHTIRNTPRPDDETSQP